MKDSRQQLSETSIIDQLIELIKKMSEDQQRELLRLFNYWHHRHRRKHSRKGLIVADYPNQDRASIYSIKDVSSGGVFIKTPVPFSMGQKISLSFSFSNFENPIKITGEVSRVGPQGVGVKFKMAQDQMVLFSDLLEKI